MRDDRARLQDMLEAIGKIEEYASRGRDAFLQDELLQVWMTHHIQIIGEAAANLSPGFREHYRDLPWADIVAMRNVVVHEYFGIDLSEIWDTVQADIPELKSRLLAILSAVD